MECGQILRDATIATTMDLYRHVPTHATRVTVDRLSAQLEHPDETRHLTLQQELQRSG